MKCGLIIDRVVLWGRTWLVRRVKWLIDLSPRSFFIDLLADTLTVLNYPVKYQPTFLTSMFSEISKQYSLKRISHIQLLHPLAPTCVTRAPAIRSTHSPWSHLVESEQRHSSCSSHTKLVDHFPDNLLQCIGVNNNRTCASMATTRLNKNGLVCKAACSRSNWDASAVAAAACLA